MASQEGLKRSEPVAANVAGIGNVTETGSEESDVPTALDAVTVTEYVEPLVRPVMTHEVVAVVQLAPPGVAVAV